MSQDISFVEPKDLEEELERRGKAALQQPVQDIPPLQPPNYHVELPERPGDLPQVKMGPPPRPRTPHPEALPQTPPPPQAPLEDITNVKVILNQVWVNTVMSFVGVTIMCIIGAFLIIEVMLYKLTATFFILVIMGIFWWRTNSNLSPGNIR